MHNFRQEITRYRLWMQNPFLALRIWNVCLTEEERIRLGNLETAFRKGGAVGFWAEAKGLSHDRATIELARLVGMPELNYQELLAQIAPDEVAALKVPAGRPVWNRTLGELSLNGKVIRRISGSQRAKNIVAVLDAFQANKWTNRINIPKILTGDSDKVGQTVRSLNRDLGEIVFERDGTGTGLRWRVGIRPVRTRSTKRLASQT